ncbi:MAG: TIGR04282 family arsenosugar biosynthesis glycosyltransferase [candidate division KSB1 bacterium]|nr:TIGR04282 family arsenosugar biosynthesis glycosyltransferase [candidate division KSB1 bacterium]
MIRRNKNGLILFAKAPRPGRVKTRLQPELTMEQALTLYRAMVEDTVERLSDDHAWDMIIGFTPADSGDDMKSWLGASFNYISQNGLNLGERMRHALASVLNDGYEHAALVGSDIPLLSKNAVAGAFSGLEQHDAVIGPTNDGGYYLIGMNSDQPQLFKDIAWSTDRVFQQTLRRAQKAHLNIGRLEPYADIDTWSDVEQLWKRLQPMSAQELDSDQLRATYAAIKRIFESN